MIHLQGLSKSDACCLLPSINHSLSSFHLQEGSCLQGIAALSLTLVMPR